MSKQSPEPEANLVESEAPRPYSDWVTKTVSVLKQHSEQEPPSRVGLEGLDSLLIEGGWVVGWNSSDKTRWECQSCHQILPRSLVKCAKPSCKGIQNVSFIQYLVDTNFYPEKRVPAGCWDDVLTEASGVQQTVDIYYYEGPQGSVKTDSHFITWVNSVP